MQLCICILLQEKPSQLLGKRLRCGIRTVASKHRSSAVGLNFADLCSRFFEAHTVFPAFDGFVLAAEEGEAIATALGPTNKAIILQNHGLLVVGRSADGAAFTFGALERCIEAQFKTESLAQLNDFKPVRVAPELARGVKEYYVDEFQYLTFQPAYNIHI